MVIVDGELEAVLGDETVTVNAGDTVLAPAGVKHGFVNRSQSQAALLALFPKTEFQRVLAD
jgi:quercetin dioxygenase-like cupin family protein